MDSLDYDVFISYARADNATGWVSWLRDAIAEDFEGFSEPVRIFFDTAEIRSGHDWELRLGQGLRSSRVLLVCLSPNYLRSEWCRREWEEFARCRARRIGGGEAVTGVYFVDLGGDEHYSKHVAAWRREVERVQLEKLDQWFPNLTRALQDAEVRRRVAALGLGISEQVRQSHLANEAPGNLRRHNPGFVGRRNEIAALRHQLAGGAVGVVTAVHGIGGMGKTELAVTYAYLFANRYQGGTWQVDADGQTDILETVSALALSPELGLEVRDEHLKDRQWLGRRVLARLQELTDSTRAREPDSAECLLLLDNVSRLELLSEYQLAQLPAHLWLHVVVTTRLGLGDIGAAGARASVAMVEVGQLGGVDAFELIRNHQPARGPGLSPDFSSPAQAEAARQIVELLDGYTLAIEQAAVFLGIRDPVHPDVAQAEPSALLALLQEQGTATLDEVSSLPQAAGAVLHKEKLVGVIVDQTLKGLPPRARTALGFASLLPPDTIPWDWLELLDPQQAVPPPKGLGALIGQDDWKSARRLLEGRRLLTLGDDAQFARLHRVLAEHLRNRLVDPQVENRLSTHLRHVTEELEQALTPDTSLLAVTAAALTSRLADEADNLADAGLGLVERVQQRLDLASARSLATEITNAYKRLSTADPANRGYRLDLAVSSNTFGDVLAAGGETLEALGQYMDSWKICEQLAAEQPDNHEYQRRFAQSINRVADLTAQESTRQALADFEHALRIMEQLVAAEPDRAEYQADLALCLSNVGDMLARRHDPLGALRHYTRAMNLYGRGAEADPDNTGRQREFARSLGDVGDALALTGETRRAFDHHRRSLHIIDQLATDDPTHAGYKRDLWCSAYRTACALQSAGEPSAADYWAKAHRVLAVADAAGTLASSDQTALHHVKSELGLTGWAPDRSESLNRLQGLAFHLRRGGRNW
jgi:tetratricopeptide (TPR) repeat protein